MIFKKKRTAIVIALPILLLMMIKFFGVFNWYKMVVNTMEPAIQKGSIVFASNLFNINKDDIIVFETEDFPGPVIFRTIGKEGDTVEIKNGVLFVNGQERDENKKILNQYKVPKSSFIEIKNSNEVFHSYKPSQITYIDTFLVQTNKSFANSKNLKKLVYNKEFEEKEIEETYDEKWNRDNFGPLLIPKNYFFVMGDNRGNSYDSRYFGLLEKKDIKGKVLFST